MGTNRDGGACSAKPRADGYCMWHSPALAAERATWRQRGGEGRSSLQRASKRLPKTLRDVQDALLRALSAVEAGDMEPPKAQALSSLARAVVAVNQAGDIERRITALEAAVATAETDGRTG
jgi:hypothetical protein